MTTIRRLGVLTIAASVASGSLLIGLPGTAYASSNTITSPSSGAKVKSSPVTIKADYAGVLCIGTGKLTLSGPGTSKTLFGSLSACQGPWSTTFAPSRNGTYTLKLIGNQTGTTYKTTTFTAAIRPAAPGGVLATANGKKLNVTWSKNSEADITGYTVSATGAGSKSGSCSGSTCSATLTTSRTGAVTVKVTAKRSGGVSSSSSVRLTVGSGTSTSAAPTVPGGSNNVPVTPLDTSSPVSLPTVAPDGSDPKFSYPTPAPQVAQVQNSNKAKNVASISSLQWGKSVAIALILLVCAAHLGTWTRRLRTAQAGGGAAGLLARARVRTAQNSIAEAEALAKTGVLDKDAILGTEGNAPKRRRRRGRKQDMAEPIALETVTEFPTEAGDAGETEPYGHDAVGDEVHAEEPDRGSVEDALAALTRGAQTRVEFQPITTADAEEPYVLKPVEPEPELVEPGPEYTAPEADIIGDLPDRHHVRPGRRGLLHRGTRVRRHAK